MTKETQFLALLAANHLYLAQFEPLRAILLALRTRNRDLARSILQTIVAHSGRFQNILWTPSCSSPALLTHLATIELLQFDNASSEWNFDSETLRLRAEFLLLVQNLIDLLSKNTGKNISIDKEKDILKETGSLEEQHSKLDTGEELRDGKGDSGSRMRILDGILELGMKRLRPEADVQMDGAETSVSGRVAPFEGELMCLRSVILNHADIFDALCGNIHKQIRQWERYIATTVGEGDDVPAVLSGEEDVRILGLILKTVQVVHLGAMKQGMKAGGAEEAVSHIRFLHFDHGVEQSEYRIVLKDLVKSVLSRSEKFGDSWNAMRDQLLVIYGEALSSDCGDVIQMIQTIHDELLSEEIEVCRAQTDNFVPPPLARFLRYCAELKLRQDVDDKTPFLNKVVNSCKAEMYHYARVSGLHVLECIMDAALSAVKREQLEEASNALRLFPQLQPLAGLTRW